MSTNALPLLSVQALAQRQQLFEWLTACVLRAEAGEASLSYHSHRPFRDGRPLPFLAPHLLTSDEDGFHTYRAVADALALREQWKDPVSHLAHSPSDMLARMLYEWFEQMRCESLAPEIWSGMRSNLQSQFYRWTLRFHDSAVIDTHLGQLFFAISQLVWSRLTGIAPPEQVVDSMEATRANLAPDLGVRVMGLARNRFNPAAFALHSARLANFLAQLVTSEQSRAASFPPNRKSAGTQPDFVLAFDPPEAESPLQVAHTGASTSFSVQDQRYRVFTTSFDSEVRPALLVRQALLLEYRRTLDQQLHEQGMPFGRLGAALSRLLSRPVDRCWEFEQESGRIDSRRLTRVVTTPADRRIFRRETERSLADAAITLLVDCSGSMKAHAATLALLAEAWARIAHSTQTRFEVLGFTTSSWHGGQAKRAWQRAGSPKHAGRIAERRHHIYKTFAEPWQRARRAFASFLKLDLYREGLDGEAVQWACRRLLQQEARRHILIVVSDGCPMEAATQHANDEFYLDNHLKDVVRQEMAGGVEIIAIGLGLDLSPFYPIHLAVEPDKALHTSTFQSVFSKIARYGRYSRNP